jgi:uncharacterized protein (TIGR03086 family)
MTTVINEIDRAIDMTALIVKGFHGDQLADATPCPGWDVRTELNHLVGGMRIFAGELTGTDPGAAHEDDWLGADPQAAYALAADLDHAAWRYPKDLNTVTVRLGFGEVPGPMAALIHLTELVAHGADLALATGRQHLVDDPLCAELLAVMHGMDFTPFRRPGMFGPAVPSSDDAPAHRQLLAFLGRELRSPTPLDAS